MSESRIQPFLFMSALLSGLVLAVSCSDSTGGEEAAGPDECVGGQFCVEGLVCVDGFCVDPMDAEESGGDGDNTTTGDGDPTTTTGDGDGDNTTTSGDGDGDATTTSGDGDGDATTTGDGDGDPTTTGDGDGDDTTTGGPACGNGIIDLGEQCDTNNLSGFTCQDLGYTSGTLACDPITCTFDASNCSAGGTTSGTT